MKKRGEKAVPGSAAGALIGLITILIIFYIILVPPSERAKLLDDDMVYQPSDVDDILPENILLQEDVGRLSEIDDKKYEHRAPNIFLKEVTSATTLAYENSFIIKKGLTTQYKTISFALENPEYVDNVLISFNLPRHSGTLKVMFNGNVVFDGEINVESPQPIRVNSNYLEKENRVDLEVHGFGVPAKIYAFENFKIIGDITNIQKQETSHLISITETEYYNLEDAYLDYTPICNQLNVGSLEVYLNDHMIFSGMPNCNTLARVELTEADLNSGRNELRFRLLKGSVNIENIRLRTFLEISEGWSKSFYISSSEYDRIKRNKATLKIDFADDGYSKEAKMYLNDGLQQIDQKDPYFVRDVSSVLKQGSNRITINPESDINILNLEIRIE